jgi:hypothetical protein
MKIDELPESVRGCLYQIAGAMNLPNLSKFETVEHILTEVRNRVSQANALVKQASRNLGG